ncbi:MAG: GT-D fold domain-containing glycosyltransferase [Patescibacteria group bacterium]
MRIDPASFLATREVADLITRACEARKPFALIRLGDGEALALAQGSVRTLAQVASYAFLREAGVIVPDLRARDLVAAAVRLADVVGVAARRDPPEFAPLTEEAFAYFNLQPRLLCDCCVNYALQGEGLLVPLLAGRRLFLVNRRWPRWAEALESVYGLTVGGGAAVDHFGEIEKALAAAGRERFDVALVAAGVPATWLSVALARQNRCVALDLGRLADLMSSQLCRADVDGRPISTSPRQHIYCSSQGGPAGGVSSRRRVLHGAGSRGEGQRQVSRGATFQGKREGVIWIRSSGRRW